MELIGKNKHAECYFEPETKIAHLKLSGVPNAELTKEITTKILAFAKKTQILGEVVDITEMTGTFTKVNDHLVNEYYPQMMAQGLLCEGVAVSNDVFTKFAADSLIKKMGNFTMQTFKSKDDAYKWVAQYLKTPS